MDNPIARITEFVKYVRTHQSGDEKGEAQIFCDRLFQAFGHQGIKESNELRPLPCFRSRATSRRGDAVQNRLDRR